MNKIKSKIIGLKKKKKNKALGINKSTNSFMINSLIFKTLIN